MFCATKFRLVSNLPSREFDGLTILNASECYRHCRNVSRREDKYKTNVMYKTCYDRDVLPQHIRVLQ